MNFRYLISKSLLSYCIIKYLFELFSHSLVVFKKNKIYFTGINSYIKIIEEK